MVARAMNRSYQAPAIGHMIERPNWGSRKHTHDDSFLLQHALGAASLEFWPAGRKHLYIMSQTHQPLQLQQNRGGCPSGNGIDRRQNVQDAHGASESRS